MIVLALLQNPGSAGEHSSQLKNKLVVTMKGRSGYTFFQIAVYAFTPMVTLEGIFLWNYHPYREAEGLVRERVGHWTILRAVATPVPESKSNPIHWPVATILSIRELRFNFMSCIAMAVNVHQKHTQKRKRQAHEFVLIV